MFQFERKVNNSLSFYIIPCGGGAVDATLKYNTKKSKKKIRRLGVIQINEPSINMKYHLKVLANNRYEFSRASGVKVRFTVM